MQINVRKIKKLVEAESLTMQWFGKKIGRSEQGVYKMFYSGANDL